MTKASGAVGREERDEDAPAQSAWSLVGLFVGLQTLAFADRFLLALLAPALAVDLGVGDARMGLLQGSAFIVPFVVATPVFGVLVDRFPRGWPVVAGLCVSALAMAWSAAADSFGALLGARMLLGLGEAAVAPAALAGIAAAARTRAGVGTGLFAAGGPVGKGLALTLGGALLGLFSRAGGPVAAWREVLWVGAAATAVAAAIAARLLLRREGAEAAASPAGAARGSKTDAPAVAGAAAAGVAAVLASQTAAIWGPTLFVRRFALTPAAAGVFTGTPLLFLTPVCGLALGWALDRAARRRGRAPLLSVLAVCLVVTGALATALGAAHEVGQARLVFALLVGALGAAAVAGLRAVQTYAGERVRARVVAGFIAAANLVGFGLGPPLVGWIAGAGAPGRRLELGAALAAVLESAAALGVAAIAAASLASALRPRSRAVRPAP